ncbi:MAG TPA: hypothetical protein DCY79_00615 [Planctomycetaceae bacterium]|nr:hypothetical protein [Blastopirellula sp.]HAY78288.1 hypothetical protein [Planctomycetaceae bacterium]
MARSTFCVVGGSPLSRWEKGGVLNEATVRRCMTEVDRNRGGSVPLSHRYKFDPDNHSPLGYKLHLDAIETTRDGPVILVSDHGAFRHAHLYLHTEIVE